MDTPQLSIDIDSIGTLPAFVPARLRDKGSAKYGKNLSIQEKFNIYITDNPGVWSAVEALALEYLNACKAGYMYRFSIAQIVEDLRSYDRRTMVELAKKGIPMEKPVDKHSEFSISNNYKPRFARLLIEVHPEMKDYLSLRELKVP
jgi:hypothetical protein